jgi:hypothetical protein
MNIMTEVKTRTQSTEKKGPVFEEVRKAQVDPVLASALVGNFLGKKPDNKSDKFTG